MSLNSNNDWQMYPGYINEHTQESVPGSYPNKTRVMKVNEDHDEERPDGTMGYVLGSFMHERMGLWYFVAWDNSPNEALPVRRRCLEAITTQ